MTYFQSTPASVLMKAIFATSIKFSFTGNIIRIYHEFEVGIGNPVQRITFWHPEAC